MGKIIQGILGGVSGTVGSVVGYVRNGVGYLRGKVKNHDPKTEKQIIQRIRFKGCALLAKSIKNTLIKTIWVLQAGKLNWYSMFLKFNIGAFSSDGNIDDYEALMFSIGDLPLPEKIVVQNDGVVAGAIRISWSDNSGIAIAAATDRLRLVYLIGNTPVVMTGLAVTRSEGLANIQLDNVSGHTVHVYVFFQDEMGGNYSDNYHAMVVVPIVPAG